MGSRRDISALRGCLPTVQVVCDIFLNGRFLVRNTAGYLGFTVRLVDAGLAFGTGHTNVLAVRVDASFGSGHWLVLRIVSFLVLSANGCAHVCV